MESRRKPLFIAHVAGFFIEVDVIEIYGKSCSHCGVYFESRHDSKVYCSSKCSEKAYDKRHREKTNPLISVVCCICGKTAQRNALTRGGKSPKTCGSSECVYANKQQAKINGKTTENRKRWAAKHRMSQKYKDWLENDKRKRAIRRAEKEYRKQHKIDLISLSWAIREVKRRILARDKMRQCVTCKSIVPVDMWHESEWCCKPCSKNRIAARLVGVSRDVIKAKRQKTYESIKRDPQKLCRQRIRGRVAKAMRMYARGARSKESKVKYLGCSYADAFKYLSIHLKKGMSWKNYGKHWHIDHVMPISSFDLNTEEGKHKAFHYTNLQPLEASANMCKGDKVPLQHQPSLMIV